MKRPQSLTDIQLVTIVQTMGEQQAFSELVKRHQAPLQAFLCRMTGSAVVAEDIAQDAFMRAYRKIKTFERKSSFKTWLFAIAYREFLQQGKKQTAQQRVLERAHEMVEDSAHEKDPDAGIDLQRALTQLSPQERGAVLLCDAVGMSHAEAATTLAAPLGSVKTYVQRGRRKMQDFMNGEGV